MRILNRPMFKYGGPIKEGIMHGVRSNYAGGQRVMPSSDGSRPGYGGPAMVLPWLWNIGARLVGGQAVKKVGQTLASNTAKKVIQGSTPQNMQGIFNVGSKKIVDKVAPAATTGWKNLGKNWWSGDPTVKSAKWGWKTLTSPTANTWAQKAAKFAISPSTVIGGVAWYMWPDGKERKTPPPQGIERGVPGGGDPGMFATPKGEPGKTAAELAAEAKAARKARTEKYLDTMGYDKAKKTAMGDALIDASAIVQAGTEEGGSLKHADWSKMINQAIQATGKRLDKPEQIREAVGLMQTKADIQKDVSAEENALAKLLTTKKIEKLNKDLEGNSFRENLVAVSKTMSGQEGIDTAVQLTEGKNFRGNIINVSDFNKILKKMKNETGMDDQTVIIQYAQAAVDKNPGGFEDGHYTVGNNVITVKDDQVIAVE